MSDPSETLVGIVDDDPSVRKGLARLVKAAGYRVEVFTSARDFLERQQAEELCCLLLDVRTPGLTGFELQEALAIAGHQMSIIFVSGHGDVVGSVKAMKGGAVDFLTKPVDARELLSAIERAWPRRLPRRGNRPEPRRRRAASRG
jgi:FixJ family two-component response regulator